MSTLVTEILLSCVILSLLLLIIPSFHRAEDLLGSVEEQISDERLVEDLFLEETCGFDVLGLIEFYSKDPGVCLTVCHRDLCKTYVQTTYKEDPPSFDVELTDAYVMEVSYRNNRVSSIDFVLQGGQ